MSNNLQSLRYGKENGSSKLSVLDQLLIPHQKEYIDVPDVEAAWSVIREMQIRGAPLIAIVACLGLAVDLDSNPATVEKLKSMSVEEVMSWIDSKMEYLKTSRPTAVNLFNAMAELKGILAGKTFESVEQVVAAVVSHAEFMLERDVNDNKAIGMHGAECILEGAKPDTVTVGTICNTGSLATAGYGTALGVARALQSLDKLKSLVALETRPYNQGSRLTAFEMVEEEMPGATLICDSMAAYYMKTKGMDACVVGADRVCANGDTANKIGTYSLSLVAAAHGVPFYVASPFTTLDVSLATGDEIPIEERPAKELLQTSRAPDNINCWNPAFDVTPAKYISGIITEKGVIKKGPDGTIDVAAFVKKHSEA
eukprot:CAMPEP_0118673726 /NCGR_PEP_ID=MMETSP0800-20121206/492_1 /TAXON_ID=210618 ORGANISM="Striatella unipunctata, Strain CCMP2910" /NCGR_SAMPLE_ID=MMETSP0800 /ASSEMBLY_ACC=CAM_ASM_000638 /LENGTH=368 /DNA_ID=CAMNT_0006568841 /DNA_START=27 /DNA_END=1133 /DNA_ORIENTATION=+